MKMFRALFGGVALIAFSLGIASAAGAIGYGPFFEYSRSWGEFGVDSDRYGIGVALDTNVSGDRLFNYRLNLGYQRTESSRLFGASSNGVMLNNMFGFGVLRTRQMRLWVGPSVRIGVDVLEDPPQFFPLIADNEIVDLVVGGGLAVGANFHTGDLGSAAVTLGYQYLYVGSFVVYNRNIGSNNFSNAGEHRLTLSLSYFFRSRGDRFK